MTDILVADDSALDRTVIGAVLKKRFPDANVMAAADGWEALELIKWHRFDLIITDLMMPELDGLQVVQEIRSRELDVPVVLMTGSGNEEIAVKALRAGATNYVPKRSLERFLIPTVESILALAQLDRSKAQLLSCLSESQNKFTIGNDNSLIQPLVAQIQDQILAMRLLDENDVARLTIALSESMSNAILHGNLEVSSDLRQEDESLFHSLADERRTQMPYCQRQVFVTVALSATEVRISIRDQGPGFDVRKAADPDQPVDLERIGGRGLLLTQSLMDVVYHNASGNEITMIKFAKAKTPAVTSDVDRNQTEITNNK